MHPASDAEGGANAAELDPAYSQAVACFRYDATSVAHAIGLLRALAHPIINSRQIELQFRLGLAGDRVEKPHVLQAQAALPLAAVGHYHVVEGLIACPAPRQAYRYHCFQFSRIRYGPGLPRPKKERGFYVPFVST